MKKDTYLDKFTESLIFYQELHPHETFPNTVMEFKQNFLKNMNSPDLYTDYMKILKKTIKVWLQHRAQQGMSLDRKCHVVSADFKDFHDQLLGIDAFPVMITIGNVSYKNKDIYTTSKSQIRSIVKEGFQPNKSLDVHVWLTLENMTVIDLTILSTLRSKGTRVPGYKKFDALIWNEKKNSDFSYEPILVDNLFYDHVDR